MNRSENMRDITSKDTSMEIKLGKALCIMVFDIEKFQGHFGKADICFKKSINFF